VQERLRDVEHVQHVLKRARRVLRGMVRRSLAVWAHGQLCVAPRSLHLLLACPKSALLHADFCGNSSAGGWVGHDDPRGDDKTQGLSAQLPFGFDFDPQDEMNGGPFLASLKDPAGAIFHAFRDQGWFVNMFEVALAQGESVFHTALSLNVIGCHSSGIRRVILRTFAVLAVQMTDSPGLGCVERSEWLR
jgi:hypothetical protein